VAAAAMGIKNIPSENEQKLEAVTWRDASDMLRVFYEVKMSHFRIGPFASGKVLFNIPYSTL
jgi:hypothetical protein